MQILLQSALLAQLLVHRNFEEADRATHFGLCTEERSVGISNQGRRIDSVLRVDSDADREPYPQRMTFNVDVGIQHRQHSFGKRFRCSGLGPSWRDNSKLIAAQSGKEGALACRF